METERNQGVRSLLLHSQGSYNLENMALPHHRELLPHPELHRLTGARIPFHRYTLLNLDRESL